MSQVWSYSKARHNSQLLLLLAIADYAHDDGGGAYPSIRTLADRCRMSERNVQYLIAELVDSGELEVDRAAGPRGCNVFRVQIFHPATESTNGVQPIAPKPLIDPLENNNIPENGIHPDWYKTLESIQGFNRSFTSSEEWLRSKGVSGDLAETTAYALKSKWPGPKRNPYRDPWATFQNWCRRAIQQASPTTDAFSEGGEYYGMSKARISKR
mgnify:CR=1 FL=1